MVVADGASEADAQTDRGEGAVMLAEVAWAFFRRGRSEAEMERLAWRYAERLVTELYEEERAAEEWIDHGGES